MTRRVVVLQSNYLPWKGYFDLIHDADLFVFYDDVQFTKSDWRTRNKIKTKQGAAWLSIPAGTNLNQRICDVTLNNHHWQIKHWKTIQQEYVNSPFFRDYKDFLEAFYLQRQWANLSQMNQYLIQTIAKEYLGITTEFADSRDFVLQSSRQDRLLSLLNQTQATHYISGPAARAYIDENCFAESNIKLVWKDYAGYPEYQQAHPPFEHGVSILDLLFNTGENASNYIWGWRKK
jgi:hypothetical protein